MQDSEIEFSVDAPFDPALLETIFQKMRDQFDRVHGGFGGAPKFPSTMAIQYLLNFHWYSGNYEALEHALLSLDKMIMGGMYDQLGGGFARYATDREWLVPHFEKMLYDNALLISVLSDAYKLLQSATHMTGQTARAALYRETIEETLDFVLREMTHPKGGFYAALDADSEGEEGKFYVWAKAEIESVLGEEADLFCAFYGVTESGNWERTNILWRPETYESFAATHDLAVDVLKQKLQASREKLFQVRSKRIPPGLDDKVLLGWNALICSAFANAYTALGKDEYRQAAERALTFVLENMTMGDDRRLFHTWKDDQPQYQAVLDDYAFLIMALVDIWQITFNSEYLTLAEKYTEQVLSYFHDSDSGLFFFTASDQADVVIRKKDLYDNATPSGNSTMTHVLQRLGILLDRQGWREKAVNMLLTMKSTVERYPLSFERWAGALLNETHPYLEIAVVGDNAFEKVQTIQSRFLPNGLLVASTMETDTNPLLAGKPGETDAYIYICRNYTCQRPVKSLKEFDQLLRANN